MPEGIPIGPCRVRNTRRTSNGYVYEIDTVNGHPAGVVIFRPDAAVAYLDWAGVDFPCRQQGFFDRAVGEHSGAGWFCPSDGPDGFPCRVHSGDGRHRDGSGSAWEDPRYPLCEVCGGAQAGTDGLCELDGGEVPGD